MRGMVVAVWRKNDESSECSSKTPSAIWPTKTRRVFPFSCLKRNDLSAFSGTVLSRAGILNSSCLYPVYILNKLFSAVKSTM